MIAGQNSGNLRTIQMNFTARRYDTFSEVFTIEYRDAEGILQEVDLTGAEVQMAVKKKKGGETVLWMDIAIDGNEITASKDRTLMNLPAGRYWYDLEVKDSDGNHITWIEGRFIMVEHVTEWVDTIYNYLSTVFKSILSFKDILVYPFHYVWNAVVKIETVPKTTNYVKYSLNILFKSIAMVVHRHTLVFKAMINISTVPKTRLNLFFRAIPYFITNVYYFTDARFRTIVVFIDPD